MDAARKRARAADQHDNEWDLTAFDDIDTSQGDWAYAAADGSEPTAAEPQPSQHVSMTGSSQPQCDESGAVLFIDGGDPISETLAGYMHADETKVIEYTASVDDEATDEILDDQLWDQAQKKIEAAMLKGTIISMDFLTFTDELRPPGFPPWRQDTSR